MPSRSPSASILALLGAVACTAVAADRPPNLVVILTDDLDAATMEELPELLDAVADPGMTFSQYSHAQRCADVANSGAHPDRGAVGLAQESSAQHGGGLNDPIEVGQRRARIHGDVADSQRRRGERSELLHLLDHRVDGYLVHAA